MSRSLENGYFETIYSAARVTEAWQNFLIFTLFSPLNVAQFPDERFEAIMLFRLFSG